MKPARRLTRTVSGGSGYKSMPVGASISRRGGTVELGSCCSTNDLHFPRFLAGAEDELRAFEQSIGDVHVAFHPVIQHFGLMVHSDTDENRCLTMHEVRFHPDVRFHSVVEDLDRANVFIA